MVERIEANGRVKIITGFLGLGYFLNFVIVIAVIAHVLFRAFPVPLNVDNSRNLMAWQKTADQIEGVLKKERLPQPKFILTREFQLSGALARYLSFNPYTHTIEKPERNQWSPIEKVIKQDVLLICPPEKCDKTILPAARIRTGKEFRFLAEVKTIAGYKTVRHLKLYWMENKK